MGIPTGEKGLDQEQGPLGAPIRPAPQLGAATKQVAPGIVQGADGKLSTNIPLPGTAGTPATPACSTCVDAALPGNSEPCRSCHYPNRPHWRPAAKGARP